MAKRIALVTGASGGIGSACARELAGRGYTVLVHGNRGFSAAKALAHELCEAGMDAHALCCDLADSRAVTAMCGELLHLYHHVDALVLCAGVAYTGLLTDMTDEDWHRVMDVNVSGAFYLIRALAPGMVSRSSGAIVTISSMWGRSGASCEAAYSASKAAIIGLTQALAKELGPSGVRVNCIAPGVIDTRMMDEHSEETKRQLAEETYHSWDWTWGKTPAFTYEKRAEFAGKPIFVRYEAKRGLLLGAEICSDALDAQAAGAMLNGARLDPALFLELCRTLAGERAGELLDCLM